MFAPAPQGGGVEILQVPIVLRALHIKVYKYIEESPAQHLLAGIGRWQAFKCGGAAHPPRDVILNRHPHPQ